jgi:hypothetical protein
MKKREGFVDLLELDWRFELDSSENLDSESSLDVCGKFYAETENKSVLHLLLLRWFRFPLIFLLLFLEFSVITLFRPLDDSALELQSLLRSMMKIRCESLRTL